MSARNIVQVVEIDQDFCNLRFGSGACPARLGPDTLNKCYNTYPTCAAKQAFSKGMLTLRFCEPTFPIKNGGYIPCLKSVGGYEQSVNISGYSPDIGGLGQRANISLTFDDFPSRDTATDPYWNERITGAAQYSGVGYDPMRGSYWGKWRARNVNYSGRPVRIIQGYVDGGDFVPVRTRSYVMDEFVGPDANGTVTIKVKDILSLADNKKALAPVTSRGYLGAPMDQFHTDFTILPVGIGDAEYPLSGHLTIGSEIMSFTRSGDVFYVTRGQAGTAAASHNTNDTAQLNYEVWMSRADSVIQDLLLNYANINPDFIDVAEWSAEFGRWGSKMLLSTMICKPTNVTDLLAEISQLGVTIWWDEIDQKVRVKLNRPPEEDDLRDWSDGANIISISREDNDDERATRIEMWTVQIDPTKGTAADNFLRGYITVGVDEESPNMFGQSITQTIRSRWLNHGDLAFTRIATQRLYNRFRRAPVTYTVTVDAKDDPKLTDVVRLDTYVAQDETGASAPVLTQVFSKSEKRNGSTVTAKLQIFQYDERYGRIAENSRPRYNVSTELQKQRGVYFSDGGEPFDDLRTPYLFV